MCPKCPRKDWRGKSSWLHPRKSGSEVVQGPGGVTTFPTLLGPVLVWSQQNCLRFLLIDREVVRVLGLLPHDPPQRKGGQENDGIIEILHPNVLAAV